jgi:hypothetical protein
MLNFYYGGGHMEDGRVIVTREDIAEYLIKVSRAGFVAWPLLFIILHLFFRFSDWIEDWLIWDLLSIATGLLCIVCIASEIYSIRQIKNGTYFTITTDELRRKEEIFHYATPSVIRLQFQCDYYDITMKYSNHYHPAYDMEHRTLYDTAFIGDSFTLVKVKNSVVLAFNNKLFNVQY